MAPMKTLFVIRGVQKYPTVFEIAAERARRGDEVSILFFREARRHAAEQSILDSISFAKRICSLSEEKNKKIKVDVCVEHLDYPGWVTLIEENEKIISWA